MLTKNLLWLVRGALLAAMMAQAAIIRADTRAVADHRIKGRELQVMQPGASLTLKAYSKATQNGVTKQNAVTADYTKPPKPNSNPPEPQSADALPNGKDTIVVAPKEGEEKTWSPAVGFVDKEPKPGRRMDLGIPKVASYTFKKESQNRAEGVGEYTPPENGQKGRVTAIGVVHSLEGEPALTGEAAGESIDPFTLMPSPPGGYVYDHIIDSAELQTDATTAFAGVEFFATDSRCGDTPLWRLSISANGLIRSKSNLVLDFFAQPVLTNVNRDDILNRLMDALSDPINGTTTLTDFPIFDTSVHYSVDQPITYGDGVAAGVTTTPEPSALVLFGAGVLGMLFCVRRKGKKAA